jgi:hypothetical protein
MPTIIKAGPLAQGIIDMVGRDKILEILFVKAIKEAGAYKVPKDKRNRRPGNLIVFRGLVDCFGEDSYATLNYLYASRRIEGKIERRNKFRVTETEIQMASLPEVLLRSMMAETPEIENVISLDMLKDRKIVKVERSYSQMKVHFKLDKTVNIDFIKV